MLEDNEIIVDLLRDIFGKEKQHYDSKGQIALDCPVCDEGRHKGNLEINYLQHLYKCWSCSDTNDMHGSLRKLIKKYGTKYTKTQFAKGCVFASFGYSDPILVSSQFCYTFVAIHKLFFP